MSPDIRPENDIAVLFHAVGKRYEVRFSHQSLCGCILARRSPRPAVQEVWAVRGVHCLIRRGETVGIIGENGSGKSTLLRLINRITFPSEGRITVNGRVAGLLDLGGGFHPELTGRENIELAASLYGMSAAEIRERLPRIVSFTELERFIDAPLKTYSQGMLVRLGFSIAVNVSADIFLIDDSLAVGDEEFQRKCLRKIAALRAQGMTIIIVSHDVHTLSRICGRGMLMQGGRLIKDDGFAKTMVRYLEAVGERAAVAGLDRGLLSVIFNAGRILLLWDGVLVTKQYGGYLSIQVNGRWLFAHEAVWQVEKIAGRRIVAQGHWAAVDIRARIEITLAREALVREEIEITIAGDVAAQKVICGLMLQQTYGRYFDGESLAAVPGPGQYAWQDVQRGDDPRLPLVIAGPEIALSARFDVAQRSWFTLIQNTDAELDAKVLQSHVAIPAADAGTVRLSVEIELLREPELNALLAQQRRMRRVESAGMTLVLQRGHFELRRGQTRLTEPEGIQWFLDQGELRRNLLETPHAIYPAPDGALMIIPRGEGAGYQRVLFMPVPDGIQWEVDGLLDQLQAGASLRMRVSVASSYTAILTEQGTQACGLSGETQTRIIPEAARGFVGALSGDPAFAALGCEYAMPVSMQVYNAAGAASGRLIEVSWPADRRMSGIVYVARDAAALQQRCADYTRRRRDERSLSCGDLRIQVEQEQVHLYWRGTRLTAGPGFTTMIFKDNRWLPAPLERAVCRRIGELLQIRVPRTIPLLQETWELAADARGIDWHIAVPREAGSELAQLRACVHVDPAFDHWFTQRAGNSFAEALPDQENEKTEERFIGVCAPEEKLPGIILRSMQPGHTVIQAQRESQGHMLAFQPALAGVASGTCSFRIDCGKADLSDGAITPAARITVFPRLVNMQAFGQELLSGQGIRIVIITAQGTFDSGQARWSVAASSAEITALLRWPGAGFHGVLTVRQQNGSFYLRIKTVASESLRVDSLLIAFDVAGEITLSAGQLRPRFLQGPEFTAVRGRSFIATRWIAGMEAASWGICLEAEPESWLVHKIARADRRWGIGVRRIIHPGDKLILAKGSQEVFSCRGQVAAYAERVRERLQGLQEEAAVAAVKGRTWYLRCAGGIAAVHEYGAAEDAEPLGVILSGMGTPDQWFFSPAAGWQASVRRQELNAQLFWNDSAMGQEWNVRGSERSDLVITVRTMIGQMISQAVVVLILNPELSWWQEIGDGTTVARDFPATLPPQDARLAVSAGSEVQFGRNGMPASLSVACLEENRTTALHIESDRWGRRVLRYMIESHAAEQELSQSLRIRVLT